MNSFSDIVKNEIREDEKILWKQKADTIKIMTKQLFSILIICIYLLHFPFMHYQKEGRSFVDSHNMIWYFMVLVLVQGQIRAYLRLKKTFYVITNRRAIIFILKNKVDVTSFSKEAISSYSKTYKADGSGNIMFNNIKGFKGLKDVKLVSSLLDNIVNSS